MQRKCSINRGAHWEIGFWLIFNTEGSVHMTRTEPSMFGYERAMFVTAVVPHSLFKTPQLRATLTLGENEQPDQQIDIAAAETALTAALGARVEIVVKEPE